MTQSTAPLWQRRWTGPAVVTAVFLALLSWTWQTWADVLVDFGVQLYVPWQLNEGKVLYRDIAHYTGPLSIYYNALAFHLFGINLRVLEFANLPVLIAILILIYSLGSKLGGKLCATICAVSFLVLFAFAHLAIAGNYNFVCPYEYEYTHATLFCLLAVIFLNRLVIRGTILNAAIAGFLAGLIFLTRSEFFVAIIGSAAVAFALLIASDWKKVPGAIAVFIAAAALPPFIAAALLRLAMPWTLALHGILGMWPAVLRGNVSSQYFYRHSMGLDDLPQSLAQLGIWSARWCLPIAAFAAWATFRTTRRPLPATIIAFLLGAIFAGLHWKSHGSPMFWASMFRPLPLAIAIIILATGSQFLRGRDQRESSLALLLGVLSFIMLAKVFFYARIIQYGCWLAMPAVILLLATLFGIAPKSIHRHGGNPAIFLAGMGGVLTAVLLIHLAMTKVQLNTLDVPVGSGADRFWADNAHGNFVNNALLVAQQIPPGKTLDCFPEGIMLNYLARRPASTPFVNFNPPDLLLFGEPRMIAALEASPPDFIFLIHKDTIEFAERFFGQDYAQHLYAWITQNYQQQPLPMIDLGPEPFTSNRFGIRLLIPKPTEEGQQRMIQNTPNPTLAATNR